MSVILLAQSPLRINHCKYLIPRGRSHGKRSAHKHKISGRLLAIEVGEKIAFVLPNRVFLGLLV